MTTLFVTTGDMRWASARIRAYWPARYMDASVMTFDQLHNSPGIDTEKYNAVVWQKTADKGSMEALRMAGVPQYLDICDPIYWFQPKEFESIARLVDGIICCTDALADDLLTVTGYHSDVIADRVELDQYPLRRTHNDSEPVRLIWYGLWANRMGLHSALTNLERLACNGHKIELTICDDRPDVGTSVSERYPTYFTRWDLRSENQVIAAHDIALVPPYPGPWGKLKSNNKVLTAWACGLPADDASDYGRIEALVSRANARKVAAEIGYSVLRSEYQAFQSAEDWERILSNV